MLLLLVGPKGSGKSHIGRILETYRGIHFFRVEPHWKRYYAECEASGRQPVIAEGIARIHPHLAGALRGYEHVCAETTGASEEILEYLLSLRRVPDILVARTTAPLDLCLQRIASRDQTCQIPMDSESVRKLHDLSESAVVQPDLIIRSERLTELQIVAFFDKAIEKKLKDAALQATIGVAQQASKGGVG